MFRKMILIGLTVAVIADVIGIALGFQDLPDWAGLFWLIAKTGFLMSAALLAIVAARSQQGLAAAGFSVVGVFAFGFAVATSVQARGFQELFAGFLPGLATAIAVGLLLIGSSKWFAKWVRGVGFLAAAGFVVSAVLLLFAADPIATPPDISLIVFRVSYLLYLITAIGWLAEVRTDTNIDSRILDPTIAD